MEKIIYLDAHATTPCDPRVVEAMLPCFMRTFGNASSRDHAFGWEAEALVERAREQVAALIGCTPVEIVFTSGGTESDNLAIKGAMQALGAARRHVITDVIEHKAVLAGCERLEREGFRVTRLPVDGAGRVDPEAVARAIEPETALVSVMAANNEIGTLQPIAEIGRICKERAVLLHCDAVQAAAWERLDVEELGVDLLSLSAHKFYGPKGVGALYVRRRGPRVKLTPLLDGGQHERGLRSGTLNVPGIVGMGRAAELVATEREEDRKRVAALRDKLEDALVASLEGVRINGAPRERRLPNNLNLSVEGVDGAELLKGLRGIAVSTGAACMSATPDPSHVLMAQGLDRRLIDATLRFGLHRFTTLEEIEAAVASVVETVQRLRS